MVLDAVSNFVRGNTDAAVGTSDTTVSVVDASIFPDPATDGEFNVVIWDVNNFPRPDQDGDVEIMRVTARDTTADELTVTRAQEMTSAAAHPEGSAIHLSPTAKMFSDIESTFDDFWDAGTQELTADVNNTNTTTTALEADEAVIGNVVIDKNTSVAKFTGDRVQLESVEFKTIFEVIDPLDVIYGTIFGRAINPVRVTWEDDSTTNLNTPDRTEGRIANNTDNNDNFAAFAVPPLKDVKKLEFRARSDGAFGWGVQTV